MKNREDFLYVEKYRPNKISDCILPKHLKKTFNGYISQNKFPHLLLCGSQGIGKTTVAIALCEQLEYDYIIINGSMELNMDMLRNQISSFATSRSLTNSRKCVIIDEADHLNNHVQPALRRPMEQFSNNCSFILTCNFPSKILDALVSRCSKIEFSISDKDKIECISKFVKRLMEICKQENLEYDDKTLVKLTKKLFPDFRRTLNLIQSYSSNGKIDSDIFQSIGNANIDTLVEHLKNKNWNKMRDWVASNSFDLNTFFTEFNKVTEKQIKNESLPVYMAILSEADWKQAFATDHEILLTHLCSELMASVEWK